MCLKILVEIHNTNFHANLPVGSRIVPYGQIDMKKLTADFLDYFVKAPKNDASPLRVICM